jgi:hypothetical protein
VLTFWSDVVNTKKQIIRKPLPIGIDDFAKVVTDGYWFVDKTLFIQEIISRKTEVSLLLRPLYFLYKFDAGTISGFRMTTIMNDYLVNFFDK